MSVDDCYFFRSRVKFSKSISSLTNMINEDCSVSQLVLKSIYIFITPLCREQYKLQGSKKRAIIHVIPTIEEEKSKFVPFISEMADTKPLQVRNELTKLLASSTFEQLNKTQFNDLLFASVFIHPGLMSFHFISTNKA